MSAHAAESGGGDREEANKVASVLGMALIISLAVVLVPQLLMLIPFASVHAAGASLATILTPKLAAGLFFVAAAVIGTMRHG